MLLLPTYVYKKAKYTKAGKIAVDTKHTRHLTLDLEALALRPPSRPIENTFRRPRQLLKQPLKQRESNVVQPLLRQLQLLCVVLH